MSLELALENFPKERSTEQGLEVQVRPLRAGDCELIKEFYPAVPEHERMFIKHPVTDPTLMELWCSHIDYQSNLPLLALHRNKVVAEGTLHFRNGGWKKHIGLITELTHPEFRERGLSELIASELIEMARHSGLKKLELEVNGERETAIQAFARQGFRELLRLPDYLQDMRALEHDYVLMGMDLVTDEDYASAG